MKNYYLILGVLLLLVGCSTKTQPTFEEEPTSEVEEEEAANGVVTSEQIVLAENLNAPWSIEKAPNTFYISERPGAILKVAEGETTRQEVELTDELATVEEAGLLAPEFTSGPETTWAPSGMDADGDKLYVAGLRGNAVYIFDLETGEEQTVLTDLGRIR